MVSPSSGSETSLQIRRTFAAPKEEVYRAWTELAQLEKWMCRDVASHQVKIPEADVRVGGRYRIEIKDSVSGVEYTGHGVYREVKPLEKLVFTWGWKKKQPGGGESEVHAETQVTVEFHARGRQTEVVLTHEFFQTREERRQTDTGWNGCFDQLANVLKASA
jgi:uncharacterized protein YndB with AHSA1/START domain